MMKNAALFMVVVALFVSIVIYSHKRTQELEQPVVDQTTAIVTNTDEPATAEAPVAENAVAQEVVETTPVKQPKPKSFASDIEALEAYHLCKSHTYDAQKCIDTLADYNSHGFTLHVPEQEAETYVTLPLADKSKISIHYANANILLGGYDDIKDAALAGTLGEDHKKLFAAEATLLTPSE